MPAIITIDHRIANSDAYQKYLYDHNTYTFIGKSTVWDDENNPDNIVDSTLDKINTFQNIISVKKLTDNSILSVVPRYDWTSTTIYDQFDDIVNVIDDQNPITDDFYKFYVMTDEFNVYKCISNNNRTQSVNKPTGTSTSSFTTADGYVWKYMYTVRASDVFNFLTSTWMPCYTLFTNDGSSQWLVQQSAIAGAIEHIEVTNGGISYNSITPPDVVITGDGTGATATCEVNGTTGAIERIVMTTVGSGYTYANITFDNVGTGINATARAIMSPLGGHGSDARRELGATYKMVRNSLIDDENGDFPTDTTYRQIGLLIDPLDSNTSGTILHCVNVRKFDVGISVTGLTSGATGTIHDVDYTNNIIYVSGVTGAFSASETIQDANSETTTTIASNASTNLTLTSSTEQYANVVQDSGRLIYISNREKVTRGTSQIEEIRFIVEF